MPSKGKGKGKNYRTTTCKYCGNEFSKTYVAQHRRVICRSNPHSEASQRAEAPSNLSTAPGPFVPKRPRNSWTIYVTDMSENVPTEWKHLSQQKRVSAMSKEWRRDPESELRRKYARLAELEKQEHQRMYPGYKYEPERPWPSDGRAAEQSSAGDLVGSDGPNHVTMAVSVASSSSTVSTPGSSTQAQMPPASLSAPCVTPDHNQLAYEFKPFQSNTAPNYDINDAEKGKHPARHQNEPEYHVYAPRPLSWPPPSSLIALTSSNAASRYTPGPISIATANVKQNLPPLLIPQEYSGGYWQIPRRVGRAPALSPDAFAAVAGAHAPTRDHASNLSGAAIPPPLFHPHSAPSAGQMVAATGAYDTRTSSTHQGDINNIWRDVNYYDATPRRAKLRPEYLDEVSAPVVRNTLHQRGEGHSAHSSGTTAGQPYRNNTLPYPQNTYPSLPSYQSTPPSGSKLVNPFYPQGNAPAPAADFFAPQRTAEQFVAPVTRSEEQAALLEATSYEKVMRWKSQHVSMEAVILPEPAPTSNRPSPLQSTFTSPFSASPTPFVQTPPEQWGNGLQQRVGPAPSAYAGHGKRGREEEIEQSYGVGQNKRGRWDAPEYGYGYDGSLYQPGLSSFGGPF